MLDIATFCVYILKFRMRGCIRYTVGSIIKLMAKESKTYELGWSAGLDICTLNFKTVKVTKGFSGLLSRIQIQHITYYLEEVFVYSFFINYPPQPQSHQIKDLIYVLYAVYFAICKPKVFSDLVSKYAFVVNVTTTTTMN